MTKVIGLTGVIGSGKSTVARLLAENGAVVIDADRLGHEVYKPGTEAWREVVAAFGQEILTHGSKIDRTKLAKIVFDNPDALARLNRILHPRIAEILKTRIAECRRQEVPVVVLEAPLLIEAELTPLVDEVWVTIAPETEELERLRKQRGLTHQESCKRIRSQLPVAELIKHSNVVIDNKGNIRELKKKVAQEWARLTSNLP